jgi:hypothetical protein
MSLYVFIKHQLIQVDRIVHVNAELLRFPQNDYQNQDPLNFHHFCCKGLYWPHYISRHVMVSVNEIGSSPTADTLLQQGGNTQETSSEQSGHSGGDWRASL